MGATLFSGEQSLRVTRRLRQLENTSVLHLAGDQKTRHERFRLVSGPIPWRTIRASVRRGQWRLDALRPVFADVSGRHWPQSYHRRSFRV